MGSPITNVEWIEKNEILDHLLNRPDLFTAHPMNQGFEAEVMKLGSGQESFVLKVWSKSSKPDVQFQYRLLEDLFRRGLSVSKPLGWGIDPNSDKVLLTAFDGTPVRKMNEKKAADLAILLSKIHQIDFEEIGHPQLPKHDFIGYFFPGVRDRHPDLYQAVTSIVAFTSIKQDRLIHGDFHLGNILEDQDRLTIIDWTNGQLGDPRYDFAWSLVLLKIYISGRYAHMFRSAYLIERDVGQEELEAFEALACLRWIFLNRSGNTPIRPNTIERVNRLVANNPLLKEMGVRA